MADFAWSRHGYRLVGQPCRQTDRLRPPWPRAAGR